MSALIIWMNTQEAKLFHVDTDGIHVEQVNFHGPIHPPETLGRNHPKNQTDEGVFYRQLIEKLSEVKSNTWLIMGPSLGPNHFSSFLERFYPQYYKKIIGVEKVDKMPDSEILSVGRKYLQRHYLFHPA